MRISTRKFSSITKSRKLIVFGGNGFVGQAVVANALKLGIEVESISRSGKPTVGPLSKVEHTGLTWRKGDIFVPSTWKEDIRGASCVVSCIGAFGSNEFMQKINGDANILAIQQSVAAGVEKFIFVSTVENNLPDFFLRGYFHGKRRAEDAVKSAFPKTGLVVRPGFMYGTRHLPGSSVRIPLHVIGRPLELLLNTAPAQKLRDLIPGMLAILARPLDVDAVGAVVAAAAAGIIAAPTSNIFTVADIAASYESLRESGKIQ